MINIVIGMDVSLTSTGVVSFYDGELHRQTAITSTPKGFTDFERQLNIQRLICNLLDLYSDSFKYSVSIFFESYTYGRPTGKVFTRAELVGILKYLTYYQYGYDVYTVPVQSLKSFIVDKEFRSGKKGQASKADMAEVIKHKYNYTPAYAGKKSFDDMVDAFALGKYGLHYLKYKKLNVQRLIK